MLHLILGELSNWKSRRGNEGAKESVLFRKSTEKNKRAQLVSKHGCLALQKFLDSLLQLTQSLSAGLRSCCSPQCNPGSWKPSAGLSRNVLLNMTSCFPSHIPHRSWGRLQENLPIVSFEKSPATSLKQKFHVDIVWWCKMSALNASEAEQKSSVFGENKGT